MRISTRVASAAVLLAAAGDLPAQDPSLVRIGSRVRVHTLSGVVFTGVLASATRDSLLLRSDVQPTGPALAVPAASVSQLYVGLSAAERRRKTRVGLGIGFVAGGLVGGMAGAAVPVDNPCANSGGAFCLDFSGVERGANVMQYFLIGALTGAVVGAAVGRSVGGGAWRYVPLPAHFSIVPRPGGVTTSVAVSAAF